MEFIWNGLLICCIFTVTVICGSADDAKQRATSNAAEHEDEIIAAEDHEHHRIIIVVPKEIPHHVNHVHTYKLADKGIPLIHSGKVVHDHKHSGKVAHEHGHKGKSVHSHKHGGTYGHQHKHIGYMGHKHSGGGHKYVQQTPQYQSFDNQHPLLRTAAHKLHLQHQQQLHHQINADNFLQQQGQQYQSGGGEVASAQRGGRRPVSGQVQFVPSSQPQGLGSFMPSEIQNFMDGRHGPVQARQQYQQQYGGQANDDGNGGGGPSAEYNVIHLQVPDQHGPNLVKHVDIDLTNNVAKLQTSGKYQPANGNYKTTLTQYNKVIGHGRAVPQAPEDELFDSNADDEDLGGGGGSVGDTGGGSRVGGGGGELSVEDIGYRFGEGYRLAIDSGDAGRDLSAAQEQQDDEELDDFRETADAVDDDDPSDTNAYSQAYSVLKI